MGEVQATVYRQVEFIDKRTGWPNRVYINPDNYRKFLNGEGGITGLGICPTGLESVRVRDLDAKDLKLTGEAEPGTFLEDCLIVADGFFK